MSSNPTFTGFSDPEKLPVASGDMDDVKNDAKTFRVQVDAVRALAEWKAASSDEVVLQAKALASDSEPRRVARRNVAVGFNAETWRSGEKQAVESVNHNSAQREPAFTRVLL